MGSVAIGDTSIAPLCVGLLMQKEDSIQGLDRRLKRRFASANFTRGAASKAIPRLATSGYVEIAEQDSERTLHRYRPTSEGEDFFLEWLRQIEVPPVIRDATQCKLELLPIEMVATLIDVIRQQQEAFEHGADIAHERLGEEQRAQNARNRLGKPRDWSRDVRILQTKDAAKLGNVMADRLEELREGLEDLQTAYSQAGDDGG